MPPITSAGTKQIKMSKSERDRLETLLNLLRRVSFRDDYRHGRFPYDTEPEDVREGEKRIEQLVRRYDKAKS